MPMPKPIPRDLIFQILQELPVRSLLRFKCVSTEWHSIIEDPGFVDLFRIRSHARSKGIYLCCKTEKPHHFFLCNPEEEPELLPVETGIDFDALDADTDPNFFINSQEVEGLVCFNDLIWNPTTRKHIICPPQNISRDLCAGFEAFRHHNKRILGFEASCKKYKVLSICFTVTWMEMERMMTRKVVIEVLTLGTNLWRRVEGVPEQLQKVFYIKSSRCVSNVIYCLISFPDEINHYPNGHLLAFDLSDERIRIHSLPDQSSRYWPWPVEIRESFALVDYYMKRIWILEDHQKGEWKVISLPKSWRMNVPGGNSWVTPIGSIHSDGDFVFEAYMPSKRMRFFFFYDFERGETRENDEVAKKYFVSDRHWRILGKHVETVFPLSKIE